MWFGEVFTVIEEKPYKFTVRASDLSGTFNPLNQLAFQYTFDLANPKQFGDIRPFLVTATSKVARNYNPNDKKELHNEAIRFGLNSKKLSPKEVEFRFSTLSLEEMKTKVQLTGQQLRKEILSFYYFINMAI